MRNYIVQIKINGAWLDTWYTDDLKLAKKVRDLKKIKGEYARVVKEEK